jgi:hypothetical protein
MATKQLSGTQPQQQPQKPSYSPPLPPPLPPPCNTQKKTDKELKKEDITIQYKYYLENVNINFNENTINALNRYKLGHSNQKICNIKEQLISKIFNGESINNVLTKIKNIIENLAKQKQPINNCQLIKDTQKWVDCVGNCQKVLMKYLNMEINSIAYLLRVINKSYISINSGNPLSFIIIHNIDDRNKFLSDLKLNINDGESNPRLIMGFGPSASGKTYCAKSIIQMLKLTDNKFASVFMTIDGGIYRDESIIYQFIIKLLKEHNLAGINNMKIGGLSLQTIKGLTSLFDSTNVKKVVSKFLEKQKKDNVNFSLYIPETLGKCGIGNCRKQYQKYIDLIYGKGEPDPQWIGLYIYQHRYNLECTLPEIYKCKGTIQSGKEREIEEGKKYSNNAYDTSEKYGLQELLTAPIKYKIHNAGRQGGISIIEDLNLNSNSNNTIDKYLTIDNTRILNKIVKKFKNKGLENFRYSSKFDKCIKIELQTTEMITESHVRKYLKYKMKYLKLKELAKNLNN